MTQAKAARLRFYLETECSGIVRIHSIHTLYLFHLRKFSKEISLRKKMINDGMFQEKFLIQYSNSKHFIINCFLPYFFLKTTCRAS